MVLTGFRLHSLDMSQIQEKIQTIESKLHNLAFHEYHKILGQEMIFLLDSISTNAMKRDQNQSIFDIAKANVAHQIQIDEALDLPSSYNFKVFAYVMTEGEYTYFEVLCANTKYIKAFSCLEDYSVDELTAEDESDKKVQTWARLHKNFDQKSPMGINFTQRIQPDITKIKIPSYKERCAVVARHNVSNAFLNKIAGGQQIPPNMLMRDLDRAFELLDKEEGQHELRKQQLDLTGILMDVTAEDDVFYTIPNQDQSHSTTFESDSNQS